MLLLLVLGLLVASSSAMNLAGIPVEFTAEDAVLSAVADDVADKIVVEYTKFRKTGTKSPVLRQIATQFSKSSLKKDLFRKELFELEPREAFLTCSVCRATARVIIDMFRAEDGELNGPHNEDIAKGVMLDFCDMFNLQTEEVCSGLFESNWPTILYLIENSEIDSRTFCSLFMEFNFCSVKNPDFDWSLDIDENGPIISGPKGDLPSKSDDDLHILHLTDIHHDPLYEPGTLAECEEPLCCQRHKSVVEEDSSKGAGFWGDYRDCDTPWHTIEEALDHIAATHPKIDYIYQTGDVIDHMVWATSMEKNTDVITKINDALENMFPKIPVYPCIGNHEPHPLNVFSPPDAPDHINTRWMYEHLYEDWSRWLPESTKETILKGGYYTHVPKEGFRIIALNNNDCYTDNWWLFHKGDLSKPQLLWLHEVLLQAEMNGEKVHILAHIPSGDGTCWSTWSREYNRIIARFSHVISAIFNGHSHKDEMNVHYSENGHAIGMSWNGGSLTTYTFKNPNYKVYEVDPTNMEVLDHETWIYNLTAANHDGGEVRPNWFKEYVFSEEFTTDLSPSGIDKLLDEMAEHPNLLRKFWRYKMTSADPRLNDGCGKNCLMSTICRIATTVNSEKKRCIELQSKLGKALDDETSTISSSSTSTSTTTSSSTESTTTVDPGDDGASSIVSISLTSLLSFYLLLRFFS